MYVTMKRNEKSTSALSMQDAVPGHILKGVIALSYMDKSYRLIWYQIAQKFDWFPSRFDGCQAKQGHLMRNPSSTQAT
uniref:Uncharacterized protein n=1 Tax=Romanomermis culicivorax TaxID=13658 RepID=A0A915IAU8_ROMCU